MCWMRVAWMQHPAERRPQFVRPIKLDFTKLNLNLVVKIEFDCQVRSSGQQTPGHPKTVRRSSSARHSMSWISRVEHLWMRV